VDYDAIDKIIKKGHIPLGAIQVLFYIADKEEITTNELMDLTSFPKVTLYNYIQILGEHDYIITNSKFRPYSYTLSDKSKQIWK